MARYSAAFVSDAVASWYVSATGFPFSCNRFAFAQNRFGKAVQNRFQLKPVSMKPVYDETGSSRAPRNRPKPNLTGAFVKQATDRRPPTADR